MKNSPSPLRHGIISGFAFFGTVAVLSLVYATIGTSWISPSTLEVGAGSGLTARSWNAMLADFNNLDARSVPTGAVMAFYGAGCPTGWAPADGTANGVKKTDGTPGTLDLRGEFIRGLDTAGIGARNLDSGRTLASPQGDTLQGHAHNVFTWPNQLTLNVSIANGWGWVSPTYNGGSANTTIASTMINDGTNGTPRISTETRPHNIALLYCVKN